MRRTLTPLPASTAARALAVALAAVLAGVLVVAPLLGGAVARAAGTDAADVPACTPVPADAASAVLPVTAGLGFTRNPCLAAQWSDAAGRSRTPQLFVVGAEPGPGSPHWPGGTCAGQHTAACAEAYGRALGEDALAATDAALPAVPVVW